MATYSVLKGSATTPTHSVGVMNRMPYMVENVVDLAKVNNDAGTAAADVLRMLTIPAETVVLDAGMENVTAITSASCPTFDLQTGATANKWVNASTVKTAAYHVGVLSSSAAHGTAGTNGGFTTADTIDILINTGTTTVGKIRVWAVMMDISGNNESDTASQSQYDTAV